MGTTVKLFFLRLKKTLFKTTSLPDDKVLEEYAARDIAQIFDVSEEAARYRLLNWLDSKKNNFSSGIQKGPSIITKLLNDTQWYPYR